ncbi:MAG TPA: sugar phosphate isomerase/epimerase [Verrucomicrobiae bacterium]|nr:sugar phosphate isomerase/epimerase [Verrucomicrobiae bacterium]
MTAAISARIGQNLSRRAFVQRAGLAAAVTAITPLAFSQGGPPKHGIKLGLDNFSVRAMGWKAAALIDYAASLKTDSLFITDLDAFESFDEPYLKGLKAKAAEAGLQIHVGTWSICPTSTSFRNKWGTAEEHLGLGIRVAKALGSPVIRVVLGTGKDRESDGGIEARIADTVKVCKALRNQAVDSAVKIAVENHAGDMQSWELVTLIEQAGKDYVGANIDSGNAAWTFEDPLSNLEILGPYIATTSLRDSAIWEYADGAKVQWTAMGEGVVDFKAYFKRFAELCPGVPVHIETISGFPHEVPYLKPEFWKLFPKARASDLAKFIRLAKRGKAIPPYQPPSGKDRKQAEKDYQKEQIEQSIHYCKESLGLGLKA